MNSFESRTHREPRRLIPYVLTSAFLLIPCYWQPHIHAGDLASHAYNAWLTLLVERGEAPGLYVTHPWTNVLFDLMLVETMRMLGPDWAQKLSVSVCVLVFFWAAFFWLRTWAGRRIWHIAPLLAVLSYGWSFQMGFFNYYLGVGLGLWACVALANRGAPRVVLAAILLGLSIYAHALAAAYCLMFCAVQQILSRLRLRARVRFLGGAGICLMGAGVAISVMGIGVAGWHPPMMLGADAFSSISPESILTTVAYFLLVASVLVRRLMRQSAVKFAGSRNAQMMILALICAFVLPATVAATGYLAPVEFIRLRFEVLVALSVLTYICANRPAWPIPLFAGIVAANFFFWHFMESRHAEVVEREVTQAVRQLPPGTRVYARLKTRMGLIDPLLHVVDRACIGHCFSYANYEPLSTHFRLRAEPGSPLLITEFERMRDEVVKEGLRVRQSDLPLGTLAPPSGTSIGFRLRYAHDGERLEEILVPSFGEEMAVRFTAWLKQSVQSGVDRTTANQFSSVEKGSEGQGDGDDS